MRILLVTGYASGATAVEAIKRGADDYLPKPATAPMILRTLGLAKAESVAIESTMTPLHRLEWEHIQQALHECGGNVSAAARLLGMHRRRSEEHTSELQSLMRISYAVFCLKKKNTSK